MAKPDGLIDINAKPEPDPSPYSKTRARPEPDNLKPVPALSLSDPQLKDARMFYDELDKIGTIGLSIRGFH